MPARIPTPFRPLGSKNYVVGCSTGGRGHALWGGDLADMMLVPGSETFKNIIKMYTHVTGVSLIICEKCVQSEFDRFYNASKGGC